MTNEIYRCPIFWVTEETAIEPGGHEIRRSIVRHPGSSVVIPVDEKGRVLLARQYRLPASDFLWEAPAGRIDPGETPLKAAKRELKEETGLTAKTWTKLLAYYPSPGFVDEKMHVFLARDLKQGKTNFIGDERIESKWFTAREMSTLIRDGGIVDGKTIAGWLQYRYNR
jgi:ADP-ribose pyrophosphatase